MHNGEGYVELGCEKRWEAVCVMVWGGVYEEGEQEKGVGGRGAVRVWEGGGQEECERKGDRTSERKGNKKGVEGKGHNNRKFH